MTLWLVRAGRRGERENFTLEKNLAVIGWEELPDLSNIRDRKKLYELLEETYPGEKRKTLLNWQSQIWLFLKEMQPDDLVALPLKSRSVIVLGEVVGSYQYRSDLPLDTKHTRAVKWLKELPRSAFDIDLLYSLGASMTVCRIKRNNAEERVRALLAGKPMTQSPTLLSPNYQGKGKVMARNHRVIHINYPVKGKIYCRKVHNVVRFNTKHVHRHCSFCDMFAGSAQGEGVECYWDDPRENVFTPHIVTDPYVEYTTIQVAEGREVIINRGGRKMGYKEYEDLELMRKLYRYDYKRWRELQRQKVEDAKQRYEELKRKQAPEEEIKKAWEHYVTQSVILEDESGLKD